jgi:hypothetical protein
MRNRNRRRIIERREIGIQERGTGGGGGDSGADVSMKQTAYSTANKTACHISRLRQYR